MPLPSEKLAESLDVLKAGDTELDGSILIRSGDLP